MAGDGETACYTERITYASDQPKLLQDVIVKRTGRVTKAHFAVLSVQTSTTIPTSHNPSCCTNVRAVTGEVVAVSE